MKLTKPTSLYAVVKLKSQVKLPPVSIIVCWLALWLRCFVIDIFRSICEWKILPFPGVGRSAMFLLWFPNLSPLHPVPSGKPNSVSSMLLHKTDNGRQAGAAVQVSPVWKDFQEEQHPVDPPAHPLGHPALSLLILWKKISPEVWHEETHIYSHRYGDTINCFELAAVSTKFHFCSFQERSPTSA